MGLKRLKIIIDLFIVEEVLCGIAQHPGLPMSEEMEEILMSLEYGSQLFIEIVAVVVVDTLRFILISVVDRAMEAEEYGKGDQMPLLEGKRMIIMLSPKKKKYNRIPTITM